MKKVIACFIVLVLLLSVLSGIGLSYQSDETIPQRIKHLPNENNSKIILKIEYIENEDNLIAFDLAGDFFGPTSFYVYYDKYYIANAYGYEILIFENSKLLKNIKVNPKHFIKDICVCDDNIYYLTDAETTNSSDPKSMVVGINEYGEVELEILVPDLSYHEAPDGSLKPRSISGLSVKQGNIKLTYSNNEAFEYINGKWQQSTCIQEVFKIDVEKSQLIGSNNSYNVDQNGGKISDARVIEDSQEVQYILVKEKLINENYNITEKTIYKFDNNELVNKVRLMDSPADFEPQHSTKIINNEIYQMFYDENFNVYIYKLNNTIMFKSDIKTASSINKVKFNISSIFAWFNNTFAKKTVEASTTIYRNDIEDALGDWLYIAWTYNCDDHGYMQADMGCSDPDDLYPPDCDHSQTSIYPVRPSFLPTTLCTPGTCTGHPQTRFPYCFGGGQPIISQPSDLTTRLNNGYYCGNAAYAGHGYIYNTVGIDCSGLVSILYGYTSKVGTYTLKTDSNWVTQAFEGEYYDAKQMDILVKNNGTSGHVMVLDYLVWNANKTDIEEVYVWEATNGGDHDKVLYNCYVTDQYGDNYCDAFIVREHINIEACNCSYTYTNNCSIKYCSSCGVVEEVNPPNHFPGTAATCTEPQVCIRANCTTIIEEAWGHDYSGTEVVIYNPTCTSSGKTKVYCDNTGCTDYIYIYPSALGHSYAGPDATCTTAEICARTGCSTVLNPALGHDYSGTQVVIYSPTCTTSGKTKVYCDNAPCTSYTYIYPGALGHDWEVELYSSAKTSSTCPYRRYTYDYQCSVCSAWQGVPWYSDIYEGHNLGAWTFWYDYWDDMLMQWVDVYRKDCSVCTYYDWEERY